MLRFFRFSQWTLTTLFRAKNIVRNISHRVYSMQIISCTRKCHFSQVFQLEFKINKYILFLVCSVVMWESAWLFLRLSSWTFADGFFTHGRRLAICIQARFVVVKMNFKNALVRLRLSAFFHLYKRGFLVLPWDDARDANGNGWERIFWSQKIIHAKKLFIWILAEALKA